MLARLKGILMLITRFSATWFAREIKKTTDGYYHDSIKDTPEVLINPWNGTIGQGYGWLCSAGTYRRYVKGRYRGTFNLPLPLHRSIC